ncbi:hypothetical protein SAMN04487981_13465 [Streptomyces sp. cf386]|nr:hypothetical protein SAMN04487981_13465 [Streptomyces sp. cf386]
MTSENGPGNTPPHAPGHGDARRAVRTVRTARRACSVQEPGSYLIQASTLARLASTHFFAAASGVILSTAMYLATVFWSSFVQVKFLTRS